MRRLASLFLVLAAVLVSAHVRTEEALGSELFRTTPPEGLLKSDPALLLAIAERIERSGGRPYHDFRADPRVEHPARTDVPAVFTVGQEFLVAWTHLLRPDEPLHVTSTRVSAVTAALAAAGLFLLVLHVARSLVAAALATALWTAVPLAYRTLGFVLVREDLSFPLLALHLGLLARAWRARSAASFLLAGLALAAALSTWHAMGFFVAMEAAAFLLPFLATGRSPLAARGAWLVLVPPVAAGVLVPAMAHAGLLVSFPAWIAAGLAAAAWAERRTALGFPARAALALAAALLLLALSLALAAAFGGGLSSYAHVYEVLAAKLRHAGVRPADPASVSFDARLLWQGPFEGFDAGWLPHVWPTLAVGLAGCAALAARGVRRARERGHELALAALALASLAAAWLVERTAILPALLLPAAAAVASALPRDRRARAAALAALALALALQARLLAGFLGSYDVGRLPWYEPGQRATLVELTRWLRAEVPPEEPVVADFVTSPALLLANGNPIVLQPKYETDESRRRAEAFLGALFHGTTADLARLVRERFRSELLVLDGYVLAGLSRWTAGLAPGAPLPPGSAIDVLLGPPARAAEDSAFELLHRTRSWTAPGGRTFDARVFRVR